jgi:Domain of unknown function (DUF222)
MFDVLDELETAIDKVAASEQSVDVERMCRLAERVEFLRLRAVRDYDRSCQWQADGHVSAASALRAKCRTSYGSARRSVELARKLESLPLVADAFAAGEITRPHAEVIASAYTPEREAMIANIEPQLVDMARIAVPVELRKAVDRMVEAFDGDGGATSDAAEYAKNHLTFDKTFNGRFEPHGSVDAESGEIISAALEAEMATLRQRNDACPGPKLRAEALTSICRWYLAHHDNGRPRRRGQPHLGIVADLSELAGTNPELIAAVRAEAAHGSRLSRSTLERLACDCKFNRVITDGPSQILDVGRTTRNVSTPQWNALVARDKHCQWAGCTMPPGFCEAHHIWYWTNGGPTNLANPRNEKSHRFPQPAGAGTDWRRHGDQDQNQGAAGCRDLLPDLAR